MSDELQAFEDLAIPLYEKAMRYAMNLTRGRHAAAEDLVQTAMLRALERFGQFERGTNFGGWLFTIIRNTFLNGVRKREVLATDELPQVPAEESGQALLDPHDRKALERHLPDDLVRAYRSLPEHCRLPFHLAAFNGLKYREIAERLGLPMGTVMSRIFRARRAMRLDLQAT